MADHPSLDELRSELRRQGLPPTYIERLLAELDDHYEDLLEERSTSMGAARKLQTESNLDDDLQARLGEPTQLALFAAEQYHARSFWGRHPLLTFLFGPLPLLVLGWVICVLAYWLVVVVPALAIIYAGEHWFGWSLEGVHGYDYPYAQSIAIALAVWYVTVFPSLVAGLLLCRTYRRNALDWRWPVAGCALLAIAAGFFSASGHISTGPSEAERGLFMLGLNVGASPSWFLLTFLPKFAVALAIGLLLVKRAQRQLEIAAQSEASS
jgi:hypothetical protein